MDKIYDPHASSMLLGCIVQDTSLASSDKYPLEKSDFCLEYQKIIYATLHNLYKQGTKVATVLDINSFLEKWEALHETYKEAGGSGNGDDYIETFSSIAKVENFETYYNKVRLMSCLRDYRDKGCDVSEFWDYNSSDEDNQQRLEGLKAKDVLNHFEAFQCQINQKYKIDEDTIDKKFGDNGFEIYEGFKETPLVEAEFESKYLTTLWNGFNKQQLYIRSGDTSSGKSRSCIGDLVGICASEKYDLEKEEWIENPNGGHKGLYIGCEMGLDKEVDPLLWAYISGVESSTIIHRRETEEEDKRIKRAIEITKRDGIWGSDMPSFNIRKIEEKIKYYKTNYDIEYVAFDYILLNSAMVKEFVQNRGSGIGANGADILLELSQALKDLAKKYDVGIITATQVNADIKDYRNRDYQVLRGGKSIADKASGGSISMPITPQELKLVEPYVNGWNKKHNSKFGMKEPNWVETVYKARFSEFPKECKIFYINNLGNMRKEEMFVTDKDFKIIKDIHKTILEK